MMLLLACTLSTPPAAPEVETWKTRPLVYTRHAECRMDCRDVSPDEVRFVLKNGVLDPSRTRNDGECPSVALEAVSPEGQDLRVVFAQCPTETRVVTAIDLGQDHSCRCD